MQCPLLVTVILHEDQVPDLHDPVPGAIGNSIARDARTLIVVDFGAWAARAGFRHLPEIVLLATAHDAGRKHPHLLPQAIGFVIFLIDRGPQPVFRELQNGRQVFPTKMNRLFLKIIAEGKIPQHLKEGVMPSGVPDVLKIVVLAPRSKALLRRGRARVFALLFA